MIRVTVKDRIYQVEEGTTYEQLSDQLGLSDCAMLAQQNQKLKELQMEIKEDGEIEFLTASSGPGYLTYKRSANLLFFKAVYDVLGDKDHLNVTILHSVGNALFYELNREDKILFKDLAEQIQNRMTELVSMDLPIQKFTMGTQDAVDHFGKLKRYDKVELLKYRRSSKTNLYRIDDYEDYFYGYMLPRTGKLKYFQVDTMGQYLLLRLPKREEPEKIPPLKPQPKLLRVLQRSKEWSKTMGISDVGSLNDVITRGEIQELILVQEALQENLLNKIAREIVDKNKRIILIAGPSSSGKTTFSHRLAIQLKIHGLRPHPISLDDFFRDRHYSPKDEYGNYDFESIECLDIPLFHQCMLNLLDGKEVVMPRYNFISGISERMEKPLKIQKNDVLIIEGIHGLNEKLSKDLPKECKYKIYVSALTQLAIDQHNRIPTTDGRLIRRIVRDAQFRGVDARSTIARWHSVRAGEERNIFPYQEEADVMFNSAQVYEPAVLKQYAEPLLFAVPRDSVEYQEAKRLLKFFDYFLNVKSEDIPRSSILREFIGGGCFQV